MDYPRLGVGTVGYQEEPPWVILALLAAFRSKGTHVQIFVGRGAYPRFAAARGVCGRCLRYLDHWLMTPEQARQAFAQGMRTAELGIVEGSFAIPGNPSDAGGLEVLCHWLELPQLVILDADRLDPCRPIYLPAGAEGILLDRVEDECHYRQLQTDLEMLYGVPVFGGLPKLPELRTVFFHHLATGYLPKTWWSMLAQQFSQWWSYDQILRLASSRPWRFQETSCSGQNACHPKSRGQQKIALAFDEAFNRYFCETLDALEAAGAKLVDFSPLRDEALPDGTDIVYIGCGTLEGHFSTLSENHCMKAALRRHLAEGRPIYAEGAGAAYLCQEIHTPNGKCLPMVGVLPAIAHWQPSAPEPVQTVFTSVEETWLFPAGWKLRGYRTRQWRLEPTSGTREPGKEKDWFDPIVGCFYAVGSLLHINFAWHPELLQNFLHPRQATSWTYDPWTPR